MKDPPTRCFARRLTIRTVSGQVWSGVAKWSLTRVGEYRGIAAAMEAAVEHNETGAPVFITNGGHPNRSGTELLVSVKVKR